MSSFSNDSQATILFVDDDAAMREVMSLILSEEGFEVVTAGSGIEALVELRRTTPDLIISDLHMPGMSGIEFLSVVRRRFPAIPAIATSGAYDLSQSYAAGVMADAFYPKGQSLPDELIETIRELMYKPLKRPTNYHPCQPPRVQSARSGFDGRGVPVLLLTCTDCLRAFSVANVSGCDDGTLHAHCPSCRAVVQFTCDAADSPVTEIVPEAQTQVQLGRVA
ncbi:response regulator [Occallatibacter savannae]|uniref:response regulator n=1 Tax=Occallatibacter savannae TaxID=1002691 RepID=UPI000D695595|nr:response regulator [Occallatibacter savannae]